MTDKKTFQRKKSHASTKATKSVDLESDASKEGKLKIIQYLFRNNTKDYVYLVQNMCASEIKERLDFMDNKYGSKWVDRCMQEDNSRRYHLEAAIEKCMNCDKSFWNGIRIGGTHIEEFKDVMRAISLGINESIRYHYICKDCDKLCGCASSTAAGSGAGSSTTISKTRLKDCAGCAQSCCTVHDYEQGRALCKRCAKTLHLGTTAIDIIVNSNKWHRFTWEDFIERLKKEQDEYDGWPLSYQNSSPVRD